MTNAYQAKIEASKQPKNWNTVRRILQYIILGVRNRDDTATMTSKLNARGIKPLVSSRWTVNSLQMQIRFIANLKGDSSLGRAFEYMLRTGEATAADMVLFQDRVR